METIIPAIKSRGKAMRLANMLQQYLAIILGYTQLQHHHDAILLTGFIHSIEEEKYKDNGERKI